MAERSYLVGQQTGGRGHSRGVGTLQIRSSTWDTLLVDNVFAGLLDGCGDVLHEAPDV